MIPTVSLICCNRDQLSRVDEMGFFKQVEGVACVLVSRGVFKQTDIYIRDGYLYAKSGGGFIRLHRDASTTQSSVRLDHMSFDGDLFADAFGRLCVAEVAGAKPLDHKTVDKLLIGSAA